MNQQIWIWIHFICTKLRWVSNHQPSLYPLFNPSTHHSIHGQPSTSHLSIIHSIHPVFNPSTHASSIQSFIHLYHSHSFMKLSSIILFIYVSTLLSTHLWLLICLQARQLISTVLSQFEGEGDHIAGPYIPTFYQNCRAIHDCHQAEVSTKIMQLCGSCVYVTCLFFSSS